jgi:hypothetical protein
MVLDIHQTGESFDERHVQPRENRGAFFKGLFYALKKQEGFYETKSKGY